MCHDLLESRAPEQLIKQMLTILTKSLPLIQPPYGMINEDSRTTLIEAESEEIIPILDQFGSNLRIFDQFFSESDFFLRKYQKSSEDTKNPQEEDLEMSSITQEGIDSIENETKKLGIHFPKLSPISFQTFVFT